MSGWNWRSGSREKNPDRLWYLCTGDDSDVYVLVMKKKKLHTLGQTTNNQHVPIKWLDWAFSVGGQKCFMEKFVVVLCTDLILISDICLLVMTLTFGYWWSFWHLCTGIDSDFSVLGMTLTYVYWCSVLVMKKRMSRRQSDRRETTTNRYP